MLYSTAAATRYTTAGLRTLLVAPWAAAVYSYATADLSRITSFTGISGWERLDCPDGSVFGEEVGRQLRGQQAPQRIELAASGGLDTSRRTALETLLQAGPVLALCQDFGGQWWLYGQDFGLRCPSYKAQDGYATTLVGTQRQGARRVTQSFVNLLYNSSFTPTLPV